MIGTTISHYRIDSELGRGGMGVVYKAVDLELNRTVALKFLPPNVVATDKDRQRFRREAQSAAALSHPNIATVFAIEETEEHAFIAMEFVDGETLGALIEKGPIKVDRAIEIAIQVAEGLQVAHEHGIVHRDIKPANIMISKRGHVKIMDFGLAKVSAASMLTQAGSTLGTVGYMSPEQARGDEIDRRTDIWGLGCVLFEMIAGRPPFSGEYEQAIVYSILNSDPPPLTSLRSGVPVALEGIIAKILAKDVSFRYQHVDELPADLRAVVAGANSVAMSRSMPAFNSAAVAAHAPSNPSGTVEVAAFTVSGPSRTQKMLPWGIATMAVLAAVALVLIRPKTVEPEPVRRLSIELTEDMSQLSDEFAISSDGTRLVFEFTNEDGSRLLTKQMDSDEVVDLGPSNERTMSDYRLSPNGRWVAFRDHSDLFRMSTSGGNRELVSDSLRNSDYTWMSDSDLLVLRHSSELFSLISIRDGIRTSVFERKRDEIKGRAVDSQFIPNTGILLYVLLNSEGADNADLETDIHALNIHTGEDVLLVPGAVRPKYVDNGYITFFKSGDLYAAPFDLSSLTVGVSFPLVSKVSASSNGSFVLYDTSLNGTFVYHKNDSNTDDGTALDRVSLGKDIQSLVPFESFKKRSRDPRISPDGSKILIHSRDGDNDIWFLDRQLNTVVRLTDATGEDETPVWANDSRNFYYSSNAAGPGILIQSSINNTAVKDTLFRAEGHLHVESVSRDSKWIILTVEAEGTNTDLWKYDTVTNTATPLEQSLFAEELGFLSPDNEWIVYQSDVTGIKEIYLNRFPEMNERRTLTSGGGRAPVWSKDGQAIYFITDGSMMKMSLVNGEPQVPVSLFGVPNGFLFDDTHRNYDVSDDGEEFAFIDPGGVQGGRGRQTVRLITGLRTLLETLDPAKSTN